MWTKRAFDLAIAVASAVIWLPGLIAGALLVLLLSGRPVFYRSNRWVRQDLMVKTIKFRTMVKNADKIANRSTVAIETTGTRFLNIPSDSPLYTRPGRLLERLGLTEIPQMIHILRGEMSVVGNRPLPESVLGCLREEFPHAEDRFLTSAGLTGPVQLVGRDVLTDEQRLEVEGRYCRAVLTGYRARLDFLVLVYTVLIVAHVRKPMSYAQVIDFIDRHASPQASTQAEIAAPVEATDFV